MKKVIAAIAIVALTGLTAFAKSETDNVHFKALNNFKMSFQGATNVSWKVADDYLKATFTLDGERVDAFYTAEGELIGESRAVSVSSLPRSAQKLLNTKYSGYAIKEAVDFTQENMLEYYVSVENDKELVILKISSTGEVSNFKTTKK